MKKLLISPLILFLALTGCFDQAEDPAPKDDPGLATASNKALIVEEDAATSCEAMRGEGTLIHPSSGYNCNQYLQGALVDHEVDLATGLPNPSNADADWDDYTITANLIKQSQDFIRVCSPGDAQAISHLPYGDDHVALIVGNKYTYGTTSKEGIWESGLPLHNPGTSTCDYEYIAAIPDLYIKGPIQEGNSYKFLLENSRSFINSKWNFDSSKFTVVKNTVNELIITPNACVTGNQTVKAILNTCATVSSGNCCPYGVNQVELGTRFAKERAKTFSIANCGGTLDGGPLYTFNYVSRGTHKVVMNACQMTWVRTSGTASFSTSNGGKEMTFTLNSGSVAFRAYGSGCDLNFSFYAY